MMPQPLARFILLTAATSLTSAILMTQSVAASASQLTVTIDGLKNTRGNICLSLFSQAEGFPSQADRAVALQCIAARDLADGVTFEGLNPGNYAIAVFHDANADGKLNTGVFGIPKEGFGFSRNPGIKTRAPRFNETAFALSTPTAQVQIQMKYL
jgi:uncharacterized protein (DUF2141 family)